MEPKIKEYGIGLITAERLRQLEKENWTSEHDDSHVEGELAVAASCYIIAGLDMADKLQPWLSKSSLIADWPWDPEWLKISPDPIRNLVKAGALIAAEIDRLQRLKVNE